MNNNKEGRKRMAATVAQVKPLKGDQVKYFKEAFETSELRKEAVSKAIMSMKKGFTRK